MSQYIVFSYERARYFKWALCLLLIGIAGYIIDEPAIKPNGGTWLGYTLGTIGALLIVWLMLFGIRKRAYSSNLGTVRGWLSAHIYLGLSLIVIATLHTGFEFGWNVHTLAYTLMMIVIASGIWGVIIYVRNPTLMGKALHGQTIEEFGKALRDLDKQLKNTAAQLEGPYVNYAQTVADGAIFNNSFQKLTGKNKACATRQLALQMGHTGNLSLEQQAFYTLVLKRLQLLKRVRDYIRLKTWVEIWLLFHVPLSFGLLAALTAHIVSVFFYW